MEVIIELSSIYYKIDSPAEARPAHFFATCDEAIACFCKFSHLLPCCEKCARLASAGLSTIKV